MQVLDYTNDKSVSTWSDDSGNYIRGFLISTKSNKNNWKIKNTDLVRNFIGKDFAVIPNRIGNKALLDGHVVGSKEEVLKQYSDNSYGKITQILGPFGYHDGTQDIYWEHITKLHNDKVASALMQHGSGTIVKFATSPHIFAYEGNDSDGWNSWEPAGIVLVSNPAFGEQSVITKSCKGEQTKCTNALSQENKIAAVVNLLSSFITSGDSEDITMSSKDTLQVADDLNKSAVNLGDNSLQVQESKQPVQAQEPTKIITDEIKPTTSQAQQESIKEVEILRQKIQDMENEKKTEILSELWSVISDEKERNRTIKEYFDTTDLNQVKALKQFADRLSPLFREQGKAEANRLIKEQQDKELQSMKKNKIASSGYKFQLPGEPKEPEKIEENNKVASTRKIGEIAELQSLLKGLSR